MLTLEQIEYAHAKVKSGADFPCYIKEIKTLGVIEFTTLVKNSSTIYKSVLGDVITSEAKYSELLIAKKTNKEQFLQCLKKHQMSKTDYATFCKDCAENGIEKWVCNLDDFTCTYFDFEGIMVLQENIPN